MDRFFRLSRSAVPHPERPESRVWRLASPQVTRSPATLARPGSSSLSYPEREAASLNDARKPRTASLRSSTDKNAEHGFSADRTRNWARRPAFNANSRCASAKVAVNSLRRSCSSGGGGLPGQHQRDSSSPRKGTPLSVRFGAMLILPPRRLHQPQRICRFDPWPRPNSETPSPPTSSRVSRPSGTTNDENLPGGVPVGRPRAGEESAGAGAKKAPWWGEGFSAESCEGSHAALLRDDPSSLASSLPR